jgi:hypothetical protein
MHRVFFRASSELDTLARRFNEGTLGRRAMRLAALGAERTLSDGLRAVTQHATGNVLVIAQNAGASRHRL